MGEPLYQREIRYRCCDCGHTFPLRITEEEYITSLDEGHEEKCDRYGQLVGKGEVNCRKCRARFVLAFPHQHVNCDLANGACPNCAEKFISLCIC